MDSNQKVKRIVLLGQIGAGKTSLFNLITQSSQPTREGGRSITQSVVIGSSQYLNKCEILDAPGFSPYQTIESLSGILAALYYGEINRILIVVKYDRARRIVQQIKKISELISQLMEIVTIVVTHLDRRNPSEIPDDLELIKKNIQEQMAINSLIFCSNPVATRHLSQNCQTICNQIESILQNNHQSLRFTINQNILAQIQFSDNINNEIMQEACNKIQLEFRNITNIYKKFLDSFDYNDPSTLNIMHQLQLEIKQEEKNKIQEFVQKFGERMNNQFDSNSENEQYLLFIQLKQEITLDYKEVITQAQNKMKKNNINYYSWIKKCPNCKTVWVKASGCNDKTTCGNRSYTFDQNNQIEANYQEKKYQFNIQENKLICLEIIQRRQYNYLQVIKDFIMRSKLIDEQNQTDLIDVLKEKLNNYKIRIMQLKKKYKDLNEERKKNKHNIFYGGNQYQQLYQDILDHYLVLFSNEIHNNFRTWDICTISTSLISDDDPPQFIASSSFLNLAVVQWLEKMTYSNQGQYFFIIKQLLLKQRSNNQQDDSQIGCKFEFNWSEQPPLSEQELNMLLSPDLTDYVQNIHEIENNQGQKIIELMNEAINNKIQQIQIL